MKKKTATVDPKELAIISDHSAFAEALIKYH